MDVEFTLESLILSQLFCLVAYFKFDSETFAYLQSFRHCIWEKGRDAIPMAHGLETSN